MPRAYAEQKEELEKYRKAESDSRTKRAITEQVRAGIGSAMEHLLGGRAAHHRHGKAKRGHSSSGDARGKKAKKSEDSSDGG
eukprot:383739-Alexandrium_andersonii.AAC.1